MNEADPTLSRNRPMHHLREHGVDTSGVLFTKGGRAGIYFVEYGASPRASKVIYNRKESAISRMKPGDVDWEKIFAGAT